MSFWLKPEREKQRNMKTNRSLSRGSAKSSTLSQSFKNESSSKKNQQISKYFISEEPPVEDFTNLHNHFDSPYKKSLSEIKIEPGNDDPTKDFRTPKPIKVQKKTQNKKTAAPRRSKLKSKFSSTKSKSTVNKNSIFKATQDNFGLSDVNADHLQMALALSKSTYAVEYPEVSQSTEDAFPNFLTPDKIPKGKTTLERYGFKSDKPKVHTEIWREHIEVPKKNRNSKFRFITPTLKTRTVEERESIIATKISLILCPIKNSCAEIQETRNDDELYSDMLKKFKRNCSMFAANGFSFEENDNYYIKDLNISPSKSKCGCLLKKWEDIPGRQKSPIKGKQNNTNNCNNVDTICDASSHDSIELDTQICNKQEDNGILSSKNTNNVTLSHNLSVNYSPNRNCISPDLFESESETEYLSKSPNIKDDFSQSLLSPSKKQQKLSISLEHISKSTNCDSSELTEGNSTEEIFVNLTQRSSPSTNKEDSTSAISNIHYSEDEDTEELYINSLKDTDSPSIKFKDVTNTLSPEDTEPLLNSQKIEVVDLTLSSDDDSSSLYSTDKVGDKFSANQNVADTNLNEKSPKNTENPVIDNIFESEKTNFGPASTEKLTFLHDKGENKYSKPSFDISFGLDGCKSMLNVTDYITQILNENESCAIPLNNGECSSSKNCDSPIDSLNNIGYSNLKNDSPDDDNELISSQESCSQESIVISDGELNYSSMHSKDTKCTKTFYYLSDGDAMSENNENEADLMDIDEVYNLHSALKNKYKGKSTPVHNRISELRGESPSTRVSLSNAFLEDSFNELLENSNILKELESEAIEKVVDRPSSPVENTKNECTPEKIAPTETVTTPENNLIIKTANITPLANYSEMDSPEITKELDKFGLKPLKRRRGVKLLKYIYQYTHPVLDPDEINELSSDNDDQQIIAKKRKKSSNTNKSTISSAENSHRCDQSDIEIVGDALFKNEKFDELIFERKFSVKIHSCRIPLQIVWHNFLSQNALIQENILLYEPLQLEILYGMIKEQTGCKFHIQDLLTFFDRKCITIRIAQGSQRKR